EGRGWLCLGRHGAAGPGAGQHDTPPQASEDHELIGTLRWHHGKKPPHQGMRGGHCPGFSGRDNDPQRRGTRPHAHRPTVSPAKNSLVYFISIAYIDRPLLRGHGQEAKIGEAGGHRITRNGAALESFLLTCATTELSLIAMWRLIGATPRGQPWTPAVTLLHGRDG